jgi:hypothetical protein
METVSKRWFVSSAYLDVLGIFFCGVSLDNVVKMTPTCYRDSYDRRTEALE